MATQEEEAGSNGWPLGLQPLNVRLRLMEHIHMADATAFLTSTPSITSESSSDLDTESTGSFFPEKSTTLGSLIGIHSNVNIHESRGVAQQFLATENSRRRGLGRHRSWCGFMGCASTDTCQDTMSPSLAHLLELERRAAVSQRHEISEELSDEGYAGGERTLRRNTLFDDDRILPPQPSGAPLKLILEQASPGSSYLSGDWSTSVPVLVGGRGTLAHRRGDHGNSGRLPTFWPSICGRISTSVAG